MKTALTSLGLLLLAAPAFADYSYSCRDVHDSSKSTIEVTTAWFTHKVKSIKFGSSKEFSIDRGSQEKHENIDGLHFGSFSTAILWSASESFWVEKSVVDRATSVSFTSHYTEDNLIGTAGTHGDREYSCSLDP